MILLPALDLGQHTYAYLETTGRTTGRMHRIEIWFAIVDGAVWVNSGGRHRSDWVQNLAAHAELIIEIGGQRWTGHALLRDDLGAHPAREKLAARYQGWTEGRTLSDWAIESLLIQIQAERAL